MMPRNHHAALQVLYNFARHDQPADLSLLAAELGVTCVAADALLRELEQAGLVDSERVRLTLPGLAVAVSSDARRALRERGRDRRRSASRAA